MVGPQVYSDTLPGASGTSGSVRRVRVLWRARLIRRPRRRWAPPRATPARPGPRRGAGAPRPGPAVSGPPPLRVRGRDPVAAQPLLEPAAEFSRDGPLRSGLGLDQ